MKRENRPEGEGGRRGKLISVGGGGEQRELARIGEEQITLKIGVE